MVGTLLASLPLSYIGSLMDRHGVRRTTVVIVLLFGGACVFMSQVRGVASLFVAFLLLRMLGQGALSLLAVNTVAMWFHKRLGTVSGLQSLGMAGAMAFLPGGILWLIHQYGWRWAYALLGVAVCVVMLPLLAILFRDRPEDVGLHPDGADGPPELAAGSDGRRDLDLADALRTRAYWILLVLTVAWAAIGTGLFFNVVPLFESHGLTEAHVAATYRTLAITAAVMQLVGGLLADRMPLNVLMSVSAAGMTAAVALLLGMHSPAAAHAYGAAFGVSQGIGGAAGAAIWARYYGRAHLGKIRGSIATAGVAGSSLGPFVMGAMFDHFGSYDWSLKVFLAVQIPMVVAVLFATPPRRRP